MTVLKLKEPYYVRPEDDDEGLVRPYWMVCRCPKDCDCSIKSWNQVPKVSYRGAEVVRQRVLEHLVQSPGQHEMSDQEAEELCNTDLVISEWQETYTERQATRKMMRLGMAAEEAFDKVMKEAEKKRYREEVKKKDRGIPCRHGRGNA